MATEFYTFWSLLEADHIREVQIPIIQRDYAQGRRDAKVKLIRERFVEALYKAVAEQQPLVLDFVYGELVRGVFVPLDGQQRLTTLFLLHWYLALVEGKLAQAKLLLAKFTYETRISSREFCQALIHKKAPEQTGFDCLSQAIQNTAWFQPAWERDPTVAAMLTMLDALQTSFGQPTDWLTRLTDQPLVGFFFLNIPETGLSEDLYLKMNARGKPLTEFENWKAEFDLLLQRHYAGTTWEGFQQEFGQQLDGPWIDFFWQYQRKKLVEVDEAVVRYLHYVTRMLAYQSAARGEAVGDLTKDQLPFFYFEQVYKHSENVRFLFDTLKFLVAVSKTPTGVSGLFSRLLSEQAEPGRVRLFGERVNLLEQCLRGQLTLQGQVLLFGLLSLAAAQGGQMPEEEAARDLLRVLRNLLERERQQNETELKSNLRASELPAFATTISVLTVSQQTVYEQLKTGTDLPGLDERSVAYEREKATLLVAQPLLKPTLQALEDLAIVHGDLHNLRLTEYPEQVENFAQAMAELWPEDVPLTQSLLIRAWLTQGDYSVTQWRWTQLGHKYFFGNKKQWYTVVATDRTKQGENLLSAFLIAYLTASGNDATQKLSSIIAGWLATVADKRDWPYYFIKYPEMTEDSTGYFAWNSDFTTRLLINTSLRAKHINPYVRTVIRRGRVANVIYPEGEQWVNGNQKSPLWLRHIPGVPPDEAQPELYCEDQGWRLQLALGCVPKAELVVRHGLHSDGPGCWWLSASATTDRIEQVEALVTDLQLLGIQYQVPVN